MLGYYRGDNERLVSVTSFLDYVFGIADEIDKWTLKQSILAVQKASKTQKLTQESAIAIGLEARSQKLDTARIRGTQVHQAIQNLHSGLPYELSEQDAGYYSAYFNWFKQHKIEPILEEFKVVNHQYGYAGRLDFYGKLDGQLVLLDFKTSNSVRWTYGLQLACYRKCLEDAGYKVDATYVVHIKPKKRGGVPCAELFEFKYPFEAVKWAIGLFHMKLAHDPYIKWYERTDEAAIEAEKIPDVVTSGQGFAPLLNARGLKRDSQEFEPTKACSCGTHLVRPGLVCPYQEGKQLLETIGRASEFVEDYTTNHNKTQPETPFDETSSRIKVIPPGTPSSGVLEEGIVLRFSSTDKPQIIPETSTPPLERHTSVVRPQDSDDELDIPHTDRQAA